MKWRSNTRTYTCMHFFFFLSFHFFFVFHSLYRPCVQNQEKLELMTEQFGVNLAASSLFLFCFKFRKTRKSAVYRGMLFRPHTTICVFVFFGKLRLQAFLLAAGLKRDWLAIPTEDRLGSPVETPAKILYFYYFPHFATLTQMFDTVIKT